MIVDSYANAKVLICDDDPTYLLVMRDTLETEGFEVIDANDGEAALTNYFAFQPDIILLDVEMPGLNGFEVCQQIREHPEGKDIPILMVTGADDYQSIRQAYDLGATDFLPKPIRWPMVAHRVRYMLRSRDALRNLKVSEERLSYLAYYDNLTGLPNRQSFNEHLEKFLMLAKRDKYHLGVLFIDLDRFKRINDTLGHEFGDKLLKQVARKLETNLRNCDMLARDAAEQPKNEVARLGGDEFIIFLSKVENVDDIALVSQRIVDSISKPIKIDQYEVVITPSIGVSVFPNDGDNVSDLVKHADVAMYYAKDQGRRCFKFYSDSLNARALERLQLEEAMRSALAREEFELFFQPQVDLASSKIASVEALIRWRHPELGLISPGEFIPIAEESGLIIEIGDWVMRKACAMAKSWLDKGYPPCRVSVNLSTVQFKQTALTESVQKVLDDTELPHELLELELTESAIMTDVDENIVRLKEMKKMGVTIAVDDFGTGYSSLSYLKKFPIDTLKIDRSFVTDIAVDNDDAAIVQAIIALAKTMNLGVIAEGVETQGQLEKLRDFDCSLIQGYLFSRPLPADDFEALLKQGLPLGQ
ncbi:MAG: EAL domain-containing protein [Aestuariibacter sp.]